MKMIVNILWRASVALVVPNLVQAQQASPATPLPLGPQLVGTESLWTGQGVSLGGVLFPHLHFGGVYARSSGELDTLQLGAHDPRAEGWNFTQGFELGVSGRFGQHFESFIGGAFYRGEDGSWDQHLEEYFGKIKGTGVLEGIEVRGGQYFNRFGIQNSLHAHGWDYLDNSLVNTRLLGEESLSTQGGEISYRLPDTLISWTSILSASFGVTPSHEDHAHSEEPEGDEHEEEEHPEGDEGEEHESHAGEGEFDGPLFTLNWVHGYDYNDFHQFRGGVSGAWGENTTGGSQALYGLHLEYLWRENGYLLGGSALRWRTEAILRDVEWLHEDEPALTFTEAGISTSLVGTVATSWGGQIDLGCRFDYLQGNDEADMDERWRVSPLLRYYVNSLRTVHVGVQANIDHTAHGTDTTWLFGLGFNWGGPEVR